MGNIPADVLKAQEGIRLPTSLMALTQREAYYNISWFVSSELV